MKKKIVGILLIGILLCIPLASAEADEGVWEFDGECKYLFITEIINSGQGETHFFKDCNVRLYSEVSYNFHYGFLFMYAYVAAGEIHVNDDEFRYYAYSRMCKMIVLMIRPDGNIIF
jgi:hypothetical protein